MKKGGEVVELELAQSGTFDATGEFGHSVFSGETSIAQIAGLKAKVLKATLFDETTSPACGEGCPASAQRVFVVKFDLSADEPISEDPTGGLYTPTKHMTAYAVCTEHTPQWGEP